jgi:hypothetical protein
VEEEIADNANARGDGSVADDEVPFLIDTTEASPLHRLARSRRPGTTGATRAYLLAISVTYLPLAVAALLGRNPLTTPSAEIKLPFFCDWNDAFMFLVSFPTLVAVIVTDQHALTSALFRIQHDGILALPLPVARRLAEHWRRRFRRANVAGYVFGALFGVVIALLNYWGYISPSVGFWMAAKGSIEPVGIVLLFAVFLFYGLSILCVVRNVMTSLMLRDLVSVAPLRMLPLHPDKCGGLRPVGRLGLRNQYLLTVCGLNLVFFVTIVRIYLQVQMSLYGFIVIASLLYLIAGPMVFIGPLLSFHRGMSQTKATLLSEVAARLRVELHRLRGKIPAGRITRKDEELIDRLRKMVAVIDELPVWPFDAAMLRRFKTAYLIPIVGALGSVIDFVVSSAELKSFWSVLFKGGS